MPSAAKKPPAKKENQSMLQLAKSVSKRLHTAVNAAKAKTESEIKFNWDFFTGLIIVEELNRVNPVDYLRGDEYNKVIILFLLKG